VHDETLLALLRTQGTMKQLETLGDGKPFRYEWTDNNRIRIEYGKTSKINLDGKLYDKLIQECRGETIGIHHINPDEKNLHDWLYRKGIQTRIEQYVAPILCWEKHAKPSNIQGRITFL
jgi:hypothetical protein